MRRFICIIPAPKEAQANAWLAGQFGPDAARTFTAGLNQSGRRDMPATHYVCNWLVPEVDLARLNSELGKPGYAARIAEAHRDDMDKGPAEIAAAGLRGRGHESVGNG